MAINSGQRFIKRNRPPRVHISYEDPYDAEKQVELPFVMGVMSDLSGNASEIEKPALSDRKFQDFDMDNFDDRMAAIKPAVSFRVDNKLGDGGDSMGVNLTFEKFADFEPAAIARQIDPMRRLLEAREHLANLQRYMDGKVAAEDQIKALLKDPELMRALSKRRDEKLAERASEEGDETA
ncbi:MAG: type VI secretion system contractile sheath small subunit [Pseudomonadota bacterium]